MAKRKSTKKSKVVNKSTEEMIDAKSLSISHIIESQDAKSIGLKVPSLDESSAQTEIKLGNPIILTSSESTKSIMSRIDSDLVLLLPRLGSDQKSEVNTIRSILKGLIDSL